MIPNNERKKRFHRMHMNSPDKSTEIINKKGKDSRDQSEWWSRADIISKFLSSVVIAVVGLTITWSIQETQISSTQSIAQAQLEAQRIQADNDKRLEEGRLTAELLEHLTSKDAAQREIAIIALHQSVPGTIYDD